jgi:HEAT repeat protein
LQPTFVISLAFLAVFLSSQPAYGDESVKRLVNQLKQDPSQWSLASELGKMGPRASAAVPVLVYNLYNESCWVTRFVAAQALGDLGPTASSAAPHLIRSFKDVDGSVRLSAAIALAKIGPQAIPVLQQALTDEVASVRTLAATALGRMGPVAKSTLPLLHQLATTDPDAIVRERIVEAIREITPQ